MPEFSPDPMGKHLRIDPLFLFTISSPVKSPTGVASDHGPLAHFLLAFRHTSSEECFAFNVLSKVSVVCQAAYEAQEGLIYGVYSASVQIRQSSFSTIL